MQRISGDRLFQAPRHVVWAVITDPAVYATVAPNLSAVEILAGEGAGMVRKCVDTSGNTWTESCFHWEERQQFAVAVDVASSDFHRRLFTRFEGEWRLTNERAGIRVTMEFTFDTKYGPLGSLLGQYLAYKARPLIDAIFDGWEAEIATRLPEPEPPVDIGNVPIGEPQSNSLYR